MNTTLQHATDELFRRIAAAKQSGDPRGAMLRVLDDFNDPQFLESLVARDSVERSKKDRFIARHDHRRAVIAQIYRAALDKLLARAEMETLKNLFRVPSSEFRVLNSKPKTQNPKRNVGLFANTVPVAARLGLSTLNPPPSTSSLAWLFDSENFAENFFKALRTAGTEAFLESSSGSLAAQLGAGTLSLEQISSSGIVHEFLQLRANKMADAPQHIYEAIQAELKTGSLAGETTDQLAARVRTAFSGIARERADLIARTETASAYATAAHESMKQAGFTHKRWITSHDEKVRLSHNHAEQQGAIPIDEKFDNGLRYPGDPEGSADEVINCRCMLEAAEAIEVKS